MEDVYMKKRKKDDEKDNIDREYLIGLQLNGHCEYNPNLVQTIDFIHGDTLVVEMIPGKVVSEKEKFSTLLDTLVQISACLEDLSPIGFTHYNLHRGNIVLMPERKKKTVLSYPRIGITLSVRQQMKLIDFGRSFTFLHRGHEVKKRGVYNHYHPLHDILYFIFSAFHSGRYEEEVKKICSFYSFFPKKKIHRYSTEVWCKEIPTITKKVPSTKKLLEFLKKEFQYS